MNRRAGPTRESRGRLCVGRVPPGMSWADLFERASSFDVSEMDVTDALQERRDE